MTATAWGKQVSAAGSLPCIVSVKHFRGLTTPGVSDICNGEEASEMKKNEEVGGPLQFVMQRSAISINDK
jgi:hypothetical protein